MIRKCLYGGNDEDNDNCDDDIKLSFYKFFKEIIR